jgi:hypothetical protein
MASGSPGVKPTEGCSRASEGVRFLNLPVHVDQGGGELRPLEPVDAAPEWICPNFAEEVACSVVHRESKPFFPVEPAASHTGIAVPWDTASELVARLNFVLCVRLCQTRSLPKVDALRELAGLIVDLNSFVAEELGGVGDEDIVDDHKIEGRRYLLIPASQVRQAAHFLSEAAALPLDDPTTVAPVNPGVADHLADAEEWDVHVGPGVVDHRSNGKPLTRLRPPPSYRPPP